MNAVIVVATNTFRQTVRQRLFYNVIVFGVGMILLAMVMGNITFGHPDRVVRSIGLSGVSMALDLIALLVGVSLIHQEIDQKTLFVVLTRPIRRWQYVLGRYVGLVATLAVVLVGLTGVFAMTILSVRGAVLPSDLVALGATLPEAAVVGGIGLVLSAFSTPTLSAGMGLGIWLASSTTDDLLRLTAKSEEPTRALARAIYYLLPAISRFNFREAAVYKMDVGAAEYLAAVGYGAVYCVVLVALASAILDRREML